MQKMLKIKKHFGAAGWFNRQLRGGGKIRGDLCQIFFIFFITLVKIIILRRGLL